MSIRFSGNFIPLLDNWDLTLFRPANDVRCKKYVSHLVTGALVRGLRHLAIENSSGYDSSLQYMRIEVESARKQKTNIIGCDLVVVDAGSRSWILRICNI